MRPPRRRPSQRPRHGLSQRAIDRPNPAGTMSDTFQTQTATGQGGATATSIALHGPAQAADDDLVHADDAAVGRALRWSLVALLIIAAAGGLAGWLATRKPPALTPVLVKLTAPVVPHRETSRIPSAPFTDVTASAGISFVHNNRRVRREAAARDDGRGRRLF